MEGKIVNFRGSHHTKYMNQIIIIVDAITSKEKAKNLLNKQVTWKTPSGKEIKGTIKKEHGNKGAVRAKFEKGLPGQAIGTKVTISQ